jgi:hypothetical protein
MVAKNGNDNNVGIVNFAIREISHSKAQCCDIAASINIS